MDSINVLDRAHYLTLRSCSGRHFHKRCARRGRWSPAAMHCAGVTAEEFERRRLEGSLRAMGAATGRDLAGYMTFPRFPRGARVAALRDMIERGEVTAIEVDGSRGRWLALTRDLPALSRAGRRPAASRGTTLLSPFDSFLWYRDRITRLFGFDYRIEVYTPGHERVHGYYTLPILHHRQLIGRIDAKSHRPARPLEFR